MGGLRGGTWLGDWFWGVVDGGVGGGDKVGKHLKVREGADLSGGFIVFGAATQV